VRAVPDIAAQFHEVPCRLRHHGDLIFDPLRDEQPVKSDKRVSDVIRGSHMIDIPNVIYEVQLPQRNNASAMHFVV